MNYLCHIPIEEFGQCLQITGDTEESTKQLYTLTDGFSVASLKVILTLSCLCYLIDFLWRKSRFITLAHFN